DPTFYPSPRLAMKAPPEEHAYVAEFDPERARPDRLAVVDTNPQSSTYSQIADGSLCRASATSCTTSAGTPAAHIFARTRPIPTPSAATSSLRGCGRRTSTSSIPSPIPDNRSSSRPLPPRRSPIAQDTFTQDARGGAAPIVYRDGSGPIC